MPATDAYAHDHFTELFGTKRGSGRSDDEEIQPVSVPDETVVPVVSRRVRWGRLCIAVSSFCIVILFMLGSFITLAEWAFR